MRRISKVSSHFLVFAVLMLAILCVGCTTAVENEPTEQEISEINTFPDEVLVDADWYDELLNDYAKHKSLYRHSSLSNYERIFEDYVSDMNVDPPQFCSMEIVDVTKDMWIPEDTPANMPSMSSFVGTKGLLCLDLDGNQYLILACSDGGAVVCNRNCVYHQYYILDGDDTF